MSGDKVAERFDVFVYATADPRTGMVPEYLRHRFNYCVRAVVTSALPPEIWKRSLDPRLVDYEQDDGKRADLRTNRGDEQRASVAGGHDQVHTSADLAELFGVARSAVYRAIERAATAASYVTPATSGRFQVRPKRDSRMILKIQGALDASDAGTSEGYLFVEIGSTLHVVSGVGHRESRSPAYGSAGHNRGEHDEDIER